MTIQTVVTVILLTGLVIAVVIHVLYFLIKNYQMEQELERVKSLLRSAVAEKELTIQGFTVQDALDRLEKHYNYWKNLDKNKDEADKTTWRYSNWSDAEEAVKELAKSIASLLKKDKITSRKDNIRKCINQFSGKKQEELLTQIEALLELFTKDKMKFNVEEESLNVEEAELEARLKEIAETRIKKGYKAR